MVVILFAGSGDEIMLLYGFVRVKRCRDINVRFWTAFRPLGGDLDGIPGRLGRIVSGDIGQGQYIWHLLFGLLQGEEKVRPGPSKEGRRLAFLVMGNRRLGARFGGPGGVSYGGCLPRGKWCIVFTGGYPVAKNRFPRGEWWSEIKPEQMIGKGSYLTGGVGVSWCIDFKLGFWRGVQGGSLLYEMA